MSYIPQFLVRRIGAIKEVDINLSDEEIFENITSFRGEKFKILPIKRFTSRSKNTEDKDVIKPTGYVMLTFKGKFYQHMYLSAKLFVKSNLMFRRLCNALIACVMDIQTKIVGEKLDVANAQVIIYLKAVKILLL